MNVIIAGAGEVGLYLAERIAAEEHDVTIIDKDSGKCDEVTDTLDVNVVCGSASSVQVLKKALVEECDLFLSLTGNDESNLVCASLAGCLGAAKTIARIDEVVFRKDPSFSYQDHFSIDEMFSPEMFAALDMASFIQNPGSMAFEHFVQGTVEMRQVIVEEGSMYIGDPLSMLNFPKDIRIASITRNSEILIPSGDNIIKAGDEIILLGETEKISEFQKNFKGKKTENQRIVLLGGGHIAQSLARRLNRNDFRLTIIEQNSLLCESLSKKLPYATILQGDGTRLDLLLEEHVDTADFFITTTAYDEINILSALQVKNLGAKKTVVLIHRPDFAHLIKELGIDHAVSPRAVMAREVLTMLRKGKGRSLAGIGGGAAEILELQVENKAITGSKLEDIKLPKNTLLLIIKRAREIIMPNAGTELRHGDIILIICKTINKEELIQLFSGS